MSSGLRRRRVGAAAVVAAAAAALSLAGFAPTYASPSEEPVSTPVAIPTPDGQLFSYILDARVANPGQTLKVEKAVRAADGVVVQTWPQIGVVVAHSTNGDFRADVLDGAFGSAVAAVGPTRTVPVLGGTPPADTTPGAPHKKTYAALDRHSQVAQDEATTEVAPDPDESKQWDMVQIHADQAHQVTDGSRNVVVGDLDSGIDDTHPDLAPNFDAADSVNCTDAGRPDTNPADWLPTTSSHGTHTAGTIAAARNGVGIVGVAPGVRIASVKVVDDSGFIYPEYAVCGFMWAGLRGIDVTNNSYYVDPFEYYCEDQPDQYAAKEAVRRSVAWATGEGVVSAAAAGNDATDLSTHTTDSSSPDDSTPVTRTINSGCDDLPTELPGVVTVSSTTQAGLLSSFSNRGLGAIDVAAPGSSILSTLPGGKWGLMSGTSMATPHVAGVLALMKSAHPSWSPAQLVAAIRAEATDHPCQDVSGPACTGTEADNSYYGEGIANALAAVQ